MPVVKSLMSLSNDPVQNSQVENATAHPLDNLCPTWINNVPSFERSSLLKELTRVTKLDGDIQTVESQCHLLEKFDTVRAELLCNAVTTPVPADQLYRQLFDHYGALATYGAQYSRLFSERVINPSSVESLLDLGTGYWNSAIVYEALLPNLKTALGIEGDREKVRYFEENRDRLLNPSREIFEMRQADFFKEVQTLAKNLSANSETSPKLFDLALMQSFYPLVPRSGSVYGYSARDSKETNDYTEMLSAVGKLLSPEGKLIVSIDKKDQLQSATHLRWLCETLESFGSLRRDDHRLGVDPTWGVLIPIDVSIYVLSRDQLQNHPNSST